MTTTVSLGMTTLSPALLLGYKSTRVTGNIIDTNLDDSEPSVVLAEAGLRTGTLEFLCDTAGDAAALETLHCIAGVLELEDDEAPEINMSYVCSDQIVTELDDNTRDAWVVAVDFQEVSP